MELKNDLPLFVDFTLQTPERGYFNPQPEMLALTDNFIENLNLKIDNEIRISKRGNHTQVLIMVDTNIAEVYTVMNNGIEAGWQFQGVHNIKGNF